LLADCFGEEIAIVLAGETVAFPVQDENGVHLGKEGW
jgi:hypothetical protein